jgi:hypothetical protein
MKRIITKEVEKIDGAGIESMLGEKVLIMALNYNYAGKLTGVNDEFIELENASIVYETGKWDADSWADAQKLPSQYWYVPKAAIESYGQVDR